MCVFLSKPTACLAGDRSDFTKLPAPGLVNNVIGIFKDTSLVTIVSLYELTGSLSLALNSDADWRPFKLEAYVFIALIYFVFCFALSRYSLHVERQRLQSQR